MANVCHQFKTMFPEHAGYVYLAHLLATGNAAYRRSRFIGSSREEAEIFISTAYPKTRAEFPGFMTIREDNEVVLYLEEDKDDPVIEPLYNVAFAREAHASMIHEDAAKLPPPTIDLAYSWQKATEEYRRHNNLT